MNQDRKDYKDYPEDAVLLTRLLAHLLGVHALPCRKGDDSALAFFSQKFCFDRTLQPFYRTENLRLLADAARESVLYELIDAVGTGILFFRFEGVVLFLGPYAKAPYDSLQGQKLLTQNHLSASLAPALQLYYTDLAVVSANALIHDVTSCLHAFEGTGKVYTYQLLHGMTEHRAQGTALPVFQESENYSQIYRQYDAENRFLDCIRTGDTKNVLDAYNQLSPSEEAADTFLGHADPLIGITAARTLARKAAEEGGLSVIDINRITQKAAQKIRTMHATAEFMKVNRGMILELTQAVRDTRLQGEGCTPPVRKCLEYIGLHYSQEIHLEELTKLCSLSSSRLSTLFKKETGVTIPERIRKIRCEKAADLLKWTDLAVQEISLYVGYPDNNYFVKVFRKEYGTTPTAYRKALGKIRVDKQYENFQEHNYTESKITP